MEKECVQIIFEECLSHDLEVVVVAVKNWGAGFRADPLASLLPEKLSILAACCSYCPYQYFNQQPSPDPAPHHYPPHQPR